MQVTERAGRILFFVSSGIAVLMAFGVPLRQAYVGIRYGGYYFAAVLLLFSLCSAWSGLGRAFKEAMARPYTKVSLCALLLFGVCLLRSQDPVFQVMDDEATQLNTALAMHETQEVFSAHKGYWIDGDFEVISGRLDKRPFLHSFVSSVCHGVFGYHIKNVFTLNFILGLASLLIAYVLFAKWIDPIPALLASMLLGLSPVFIDAATSAGFEIMNFMFLGLLGLAVSAYTSTSRPSADSERFMVSTVLCLSYLRYESGAVLLPIAAYIVYRYLQNKDRQMSLCLLLAPFGYVPVVWLYRTASARVDAWPQAEALNEGLFTVGNFIPNVSDAMSFFSNYHFGSSNNLSLAIAGVCGLSIFACSLVCQRVFRRRSLIPVFPESENTAIVAVLIWLVALLLPTTVVLFYFWSSFLDPLAQRMSLPILWPMTFGVAYLIAGIFRFRPILKYMALGCVLLGGVYSVGSGLSRDAVNQRTPLARLQQWKYEWAEQHISEPSKVLVIDPSHHVWTAMRVGVISPELLRQRLPHLKFHWQAKTFKEIYQLELLVHHGNGEWRQPGAVLPVEVEFEADPVAELRLTDDCIARLRRVRGVAGRSALFDQFWDSQEGLAPSEVQRNFRLKSIFYLP